MVISKGRYGNGEFKNVLPLSVQIRYLPVQGRKLPRVMGNSIRSREESCETSSLPNPMVSHLNQCNGFIRRKLPAWRVQTCIALVAADTVLTSAGPQTTACNVCETSGLPNPIVPPLYQWNGYIKRKLPAWRVQKCIALVGADTVLTSAGPQTTSCHGG